MFSSEEIQQLKLCCQSATSILITGPEATDGDSIGACQALKEIILQQHSVQIDCTGQVDFQYTWMAGLDEWKSPTELQQQYDVAIVLDGNFFRLNDTVQHIFENSKHRILIDHHQPTDFSPYTLVLLNSTSPSTCSMIAKIAMEWKISLTKTMAQALYTGIIFDTGGFQHDNTDAQTHRIVADLMDTGFDANFVYSKVLVEKKPSGLRLMCYVLQYSEYLADGFAHVIQIPQKTFQELDCSYSDTEGLANLLLYTTGVDVSFLLLEKQDGCKISFRSRSAFYKHDINCATFAKSLYPSGGGHIKAAGVFIPYHDGLPNSTAIYEHVKNRLNQLLSESQPS